jgi:hypothetical protein
MPSVWRRRRSTVRRPEAGSAWVQQYQRRAIPQSSARSRLSADLTGRNLTEEHALTLCIAEFRYFSSDSRGPIPTHRFGKSHAWATAKHPFVRRSVAGAAWSRPSAWHECPGQHHCVTGATSRPERATSMGGAACRPMSSRRGPATLRTAPTPLQACNLPLTLWLMRGLESFDP